MDITTGRAIFDNSSALTHHVFFLKS